jgi:surface polysaccharide O-acyltransferase-like enzyme
MMEFVWTSETLVNLYQSTWHYNPEDSHLHTHCHENLKSYMMVMNLINSLVENVNTLRENTETLLHIIIMTLSITVNQSTNQFYQHFKGAYCLCHQFDDEGSSKHL